MFWKDFSCSVKSGMILKQTQAPFSCFQNVNQTEMFLIVVFDTIELLRFKYFKVNLWVFHSQEK